MKVMMQGKFLKDCMKRNRRLGGSRDVPVPSSSSSSSSAAGSPAASCSKCCRWLLWPLMQDKSDDIPRDVPKGHLVVYVGECHKRYVIKVTLLKHPLFRALLDLAQEVYGFNADSKLCIPCDESMFLSVVRCAASPENPQVCVCL